VSDNTIKTENRWRLSKIHGVVTSKSKKTIYTWLAYCRASAVFLRTDL